MPHPPATATAGSSRASTSGVTTSPVGSMLVSMSTTTGADARRSPILSGRALAQPFARPDDRRRPRRRPERRVQASARPTVRPRPRRSTCPRARSRGATRRHARHRSGQSVATARRWPDRPAVRRNGTGRSERRRSERVRPRRDRPARLARGRSRSLGRRSSSRQPRSRHEAGRPWPSRARRAPWTGRARRTGPRRDPLPVHLELVARRPLPVSCAAPG